METQTTIGKLSATRRQENGKSIARKLRAQGLIPAVCYGGGGESIALSLNPAELKRCLDPGKRRNTVIELTVGEGSKTELIKVMVKDYQMDTLKQTMLHADFIRVQDDQPVEVSVPLILEGKPEGVKLGGVLHQVFRKLPVRCLPSLIPTQIVADVTPLVLGQVLRVSDLATLEAGVAVALPANQTIAGVMVPRKVAEEAATTAAATGEAAAEGEAKEGEAKESAAKE